MKVFDATRRKLVECFVKAGSVGVNVNDDLGQLFQTQKGLRQGDWMFPIMFNVVADMLVILIGRAKEDDLVGGLIPLLVDGSVSILHYDDDTIIFMEHDMDKAINMKSVLWLFEQLSWLKIIFHNNVLFLLWMH